MEEKENDKARLMPSKGKTEEAPPFTANVEKSFDNPYLVPLSVSVFLFFAYTADVAQVLTDWAKLIEDRGIRANVLMCALIVWLISIVAVPSLITKLLLDYVRRRKQKNR